MWREAAGLTSRIEQRVVLRFDYPVVFTQRMFDPDNETLTGLVAHGAERRAKFLVVIDEGVDAGNPSLYGEVERYFQAHAALLQLGGPPLVIPGGERAKNGSAVVELVLERLFKLGFDRHAYLLVMGGGAVLDAVGYAASLFHRGLRLIRVPTTVLAQDDAGVGVKNGINAFGAKNALGTFAPPFAVINDFSLLASLSERDHRAGIAEAIKVALIRDAVFFSWIEEHAAALRARAPRETQALIRRCAELHLEHIREGGDPFENGSARPLDFGHWAAHKLEVLTEHALRHGEAVAIGMVLDTRYAQLVGLVDSSISARVERVCDAVGLPTFDEALRRRDPDGRAAVLHGLEEFREHLGGQLTVTLLAEVGRGVQVHEIDHPLMQQAIDALAAR